MSNLTQAKNGYKFYFKFNKSTIKRSLDYKRLIIGKTLIHSAAFLEGNHVNRRMWTMVCKTYLIAQHNKFQFLGKN